MVMALRFTPSGFARLLASVSWRNHPVVPRRPGCARCRRGGQPFHRSLAGGQAWTPAAARSGV